MRPVLVDSNVLLDIITDDPRWSSWSSEQLATLANETQLVINPIIFSEVSIGFLSLEDAESVNRSGFIGDCLVKIMPRFPSWHDGGKIAPRIFEAKDSRAGHIVVSC